MDPKEEEALEFVSIAEQLIRGKNFRIARNMLNPAEEIFPTAKARDLLTFISTELASVPERTPSRHSVGRRHHIVNSMPNEVPKIGELLTTESDKAVSSLLTCFIFSSKC